MKETRYAVLIGMNNYKKNPLLYSIKDVHDVRDVLTNNCKFASENVFIVENSITPVIEQIQNSFEDLQKTFNPGIDLILFYYSGHGEYNEKDEESMLYFEDETSLGISNIALNYFMPLKSRNHYIIIDACHSGKHIYINPKHNSLKVERKLLNDSAELYFLFAAEQNKKAFQNDMLKNSYYTYYLVEAIKNREIYDDDGFLTMNSIDEYIRKKISRRKDVVQIPGSESRSTGYKPFAFLKKKSEENIETQNPEKKSTMENTTEDFNLDQSITSENRQKIQEKLKILLQREIQEFPIDDLAETYEIKVEGQSNRISYEIEAELEKSIIVKAKKNNLEAINDLFSVKLIKQNRTKIGLSAVFDMLHGAPEPEYSYDIKYNDRDIVPAYIEMKAKTFQDASGGLFCIFYQAKFGFVFCKAFFKYEWDGTDDKISSFIAVDLTSYRLIEKNIAEAEKDLHTALHELGGNIKKWSADRKKEIDQFLKNAK